MARDRLDTDALYAALDAQRKARELSWRQLALEVGVSPSTMTRLANGQRPDVDAFAGLVRWLGQPADTFLVGDDQAPREEPDLVAQLAPLLRARRDLSDDDAKYLEDLISVAVRRFKAERAELPVRRGFKTEARKLALELRAELGLDAYAKFDPYALAAEYGIPVFGLSDLGQDPAAGKAAAHYASNGSATFSAALVPVGNTRLILDNDAHDPRRRRNSVSHEMSHLVLEHEFGQVLLTGDGYRAFSPDREEEADWLGGEMLIPYAAAERAARLDWNDEQVAEEFDVSIQLARMRMNYSGARTVVARKRAWRNRNLEPRRALGEYTASTPARPAPTGQGCFHPADGHRERRQDRHPECRLTSSDLKGCLFGGVRSLRRCTSGSTTRLYGRSIRRAPLSDSV